MSLLTDHQIKTYMDYGAVVIDPFREDRLNTDSYDLELGPFFYRYSKRLTRRPAAMEQGDGFELVDARAEGGIWMGVGERILGHSVEVAGGKIGKRTIVDSDLIGGHKSWERSVAVTTHLQATSTAARHGISACMCAGWGDVTFVNRWTMEITNHSPDRLFLPVGAIIAQIAFTEVECPSSDYMQKTGNYALDSVDPDIIHATWTPENMLPKTLKTRETWKQYFLEGEDDSE